MNSNKGRTNLIRRVVPIFAIFFAVTAGVCVHGACDLRITRAGPWNGGTWTPPRVGGGYELRVDMSVYGTPTNAFRIKFTIANTTRYLDNLNLGPGGYWWYFFWYVDLDDEMPWSITLDPDGVSGDTNLVNNTASGTFTPVPPATAVELYSPRLMNGSETSSLTFQAGASISELYVLFGAPSSHGAQSVVSLAGPGGGNYIGTPPYGAPVFEIARTNVIGLTFKDTNSFLVRLSRIRVNPGVLRTGTWADLATLTTNWTQWLAPDARCQCTDPRITSFVQQSLPSNYLATLTPYDTARTLHRAVIKKLANQSSPTYNDAVGVLQNGGANGAGFSALLTASLRNVGIPARCISGFKQGTSAWHVRVEFHLPGVEWLVADPAGGDGNDPTGTYAYGFGYVPDADRFVAVDVGDRHITPYSEFEFLQVPGWWWAGGAALASHTAQSYLQPNGVLSITNAANGTVSLVFKDPPTQGSVVLQSSTDLLNWSPIVTNAANGNTIYYSLRQNGSPQNFYRVNLIP